MTFDDAKTTCQNMDAFLVEIKDQAEMEAVANLVLHQIFYVNTGIYENVKTQYTCNCVN